MRLAAGWRRIRDPGAIDAFVRTCLVRAYLAESRRVWRHRERTVAQPPDVGYGLSGGTRDFYRSTDLSAWTRVSIP